MPAKLKKSTIRFDLMWKSKGLSAVREGARLTSRIHALRSLSSNMS